VRSSSSCTMRVGGGRPAAVAAAVTCRPAGAVRVCRMVAWRRAGCCSCCCWPCSSDSSTAAPLPPAGKVVVAAKGLRAIPF
jgi:hypothetical protein